MPRWKDEGDPWGRLPTGSLGPGSVEGLSDRQEEPDYPPWGPCLWTSLGEAVMKLLDPPGHQLILPLPLS